MPFESSYGIIPLCKKDGGWHVLLVQLHAGHWGFPKGHAERNEQPGDAASRELAEETGLHVSHFLSDQTLIEAYHFFSRGRRIQKTVTYFLAEVSGHLHLQLEEIKDAKWVPLAEAVHYLTFPASQAVIKRAEQLLKSS